MWIRSLKCFLAVVLFTCAFLANSGSVSADAHDGAGASALSSIGALENIENIPGIQDRHKGIRSYDNTDFPRDNNANRGVKSYGTPSGHDASHDHGIKGGGHGYNKNNDGCSKCKWENDDYWERDEPEEEGDENDGDECDDGQYKPDKTHHHHGPGRGHRPGSHPSGVHKTGPTGVYGGDERGSSAGGSLGGINYPGTGYSKPISSYESTPKPGSSWNTPFVDTSKPAYGSVTAGAFGTTPSSWSNSNRGTTPGDSGSPTKPTWSSGHDSRFPSSFGAPVSNSGITTKPEQGWNINQFPSGSSSAVPHTGSSISSPSSYGNPQENQNKPYGQPGTQSTYAGTYAGASVASGIGNPYGVASNEKKNHPFGFHKPINTQPSQGPYSETNQAPSNIDYYGLGGYDKPRSGPGSYSTPRTVTNTFGIIKGSHEGDNSPKTAPDAQTNLFAPEKSPVSSIGSSVYEHPGVTKPSYSGSTTSWLGADQTGSGSSTWHGTGTTPHAGFPTSNIGFGTTKPPLNHVSIPSSTLSVPYDRTRPKQPNFNVASSATANAGANAFGTRTPSTYSIPSITGTTPLYGTSAHRGSYTPGVKGSIGSTRPAYGTVPQGTYPNIESGTWPGRQPGSSIGLWPSGKPGDGSGITPDRHSPGVSGILPKQPQDGSRTWPTGQPASGSRTNQIQPGRGSGPGCGPGGNCGDTIGSQGDSNCGGCCGNYNCDSGCSGKDNVHELCGGVIGPSGVNKISGISSGNVPNIGIVYGPDSHLTGAGIKPVYPGTQDTSATLGSSVPWNSANPFLYGVGGGTPSSVSHPWTETTDKPIGSGNPFLDSSWNSPKPGYNNNDRNVIPHGQENIKPIGQGNLFLDGSNRRGHNPNESVVPLGGKISEGNNPFLTSLGGNSGSGSPSSSKYPDRSGTPESFSGSGTPESFPGSGISGSFSGPGTRENYPKSGTSGNYPGSGAIGNSGYGGVKGGFHSGRVSPHDGNNDRSYPQSGDNPQGIGPLQCKLGLFGCGTPGSGSYAGDKHLGAFGNVGIDTGSPRDVDNVPGGSGNRGIGPVPGHFAAGASHPGSGGSNLAASVGSAQARAYAGSFSSAQASSSSFAGSFSGTSGLANNFGNLSPEAQNQGGLNSWASSGASAFASSSAGSWSGNRPIDVKG